MKGKLAAAAVLALFLAGAGGDFLPYATDITTVELMRTIGLDGGTDGRLRVTVCGGVQQTNSGGDPQPPLLLTGEADTVYAACTQLETHSDDYIFYGHVTHCLLGQSAAAMGTDDLLDFLERDIQMRLITKLYVVRGEAGEALAAETGETWAPVDRLDAIGKDFAVQSTSYGYSVGDFAAQLEQNGCALAPALVLAPAAGGRPGEETPRTLQISGFAWFRDGVLAGYLGEGAARGANVLLNQVESGTVDVPLPGGGRAALRLTQCKCEWTPEIEDGVLTGLTARWQVQADLAELRGKNDPEDPAVLSALETSLAHRLRREAMAAVFLSQQGEADFLHLEQKARLAAPGDWGAIRAGFRAGFGDLPIRVEVSAAVARTYDVSRPMAL